MLTIPIVSPSGGEHRRKGAGPQPVDQQRRNFAGRRSSERRDGRIDEGRLRGQLLGAALLDEGPFAAPQEGRGGQRRRKAGEKHRKGGCHSG